MSKETENQLGIWGAYKAMLKYQSRYPFFLVIIILALLVKMSYDLIFPLISEWLFNTVLYSHNLKLFGYALLLLGIALFFFTLGHLIIGLTTPKLAYRVVTTLRYKLFGQVLALNPEEDSEQIGQLNMYLINDINNIVSLGSYFMWSAASNSLLVILGTTTLLYFNWKMTLLAAMVIPITLVLPRFFSKANRRQFEVKHELESTLVDKLNEMVTMQDIIRLFRLQRFIRKQFRLALLPARIAGEKYGRLSEFTYRSTSVGTAVVQYAIILVGGYFVMVGQLTAGKLIGFYLLFVNVMNSINNLIYLYPTLITSAGSIQKIQTLLGKKAFSSKVPKNLIKQFENSIQLNNVDLNYDGQPILKDVNLNIPKGKYVALIGSSGSGKSTLLRLLLKVLSPSEGELKFDNVNYMDIVSHSLLAQIGMISQQPKLFSMSIMENIRMGNMNASDEEVILAAKKAEVHEDIMQLPKQYQTLIGAKEGVRLSGGQAQRVTIARAILSNPTILCCDEATSALDPISGAAIDELLLKMSKKHTIIAVTHRLSSVVHADHIVVLNQGEVVERGTHQELLDLNGYYAKLWEKQHGFVYNPNTQETTLIPEWLKMVPLFTGLPLKTLKKFAHEFVMERKSPKQLVFSEGDRGEKFYILVAGIVEIFTQDESSQEKVIAKLSDGDFFGEVALIYNMPRNASIRTKGVCVFLTLHYQKFQKIFHLLSESQQQSMLEIAKQRLSAKQREELEM